MAGNLFGASRPAYRPAYFYATAFILMFGIVLRGMTKEMLKTTITNIFVTKIQYIVDNSITEVW